MSSVLVYVGYKVATFYTHSIARKLWWTWLLYSQLHIDETCYEVVLWPWLLILATMSLT